jgi:hypothetical protein
MIKCGKFQVCLGATILVVGSAPLAEAHRGGGRITWQHGGYHHMRGDHYHNDRNRMHHNRRHEHIDHHRMRTHQDHSRRGNVGRTDEILPHDASKRSRTDEIMPQRRVR